MGKTFLYCLSVLELISFISAQGRNIALNQNASQLNTLEFSEFLWSADKAVDNCTLQDDPNTQQCCSVSVGTTDNYWRVDFDQAYTINSIVVIGRDSAFASQTKDFRVTIVTGSGEQEQIYDNACCEYGDGRFTIAVSDRTVIAVIITLPTENLLTLCEVQVFEVEPVITTTAAAATTDSPLGQNATMTQNQTTSMTSSVSQSQTTGMPSSTTRTDVARSYSFFLYAVFVWKYLYM